MARIRLNLKNLTVTEKVAKGRQIVTAMSNNTSFPNPNPPLAEVTAALDELTQAFALVQASHLRQAVMVHRLTSLRRHEEMARTIAVKRAK